MIKNILILIAIFTIQSNASTEGASGLIDDPCAEAIRCSPGNDGDLSDIEVKKIYTCILNETNLDNQFVANTLILKNVETSGESKFSTSKFSSESIELIVDTNFNAIRRVTIVHSGLKSSAFADSTDSISGGPGNTANLVDLKKQKIYSAFCFTPLK